MQRYAAVRARARSANDLTSPLIAGITWLAAVSLVHAGEIYKSVDADGNVVYSDHLDSASQFTVVQLESAGLPPHVMHLCWTNCFTLTLDHGTYRRTDGTDESWTVETFSASRVVLHRHDAPAAWNGNSEDVVYAGRVANDRLADVTVNGKPVSGIDAAWGSALDFLPGSNAERDGASSANPGSSSGGTVSSATPPPPLPAEDQPTLPEDGYLWTPGYWYWRDRRYFWMHGAWVLPPQIGFLWTPGFWGLAGAVFVFHPGHWGSTVGFYGGMNYGHGYFGNGYTGGHWVGNSFAYNNAVNRLNPAVAHHAYAEPPQDQVLRRAPIPVHQSGEPAPKFVARDRSAPAASAPPAGSPSRSNRVAPAAGSPSRSSRPAPARSAPLKQ